MNGTTSTANGTSPHPIPIQIGGEEVQTPTTFDVTDPGTGKVLWQSSSASKTNAIRAVESAQAAFPAWSKTKPAARRDILLKASDVLKERGTELAEYMIKETGADDGNSSGFNIPKSVEMLRDVAGRISTVTGYNPACEEDGKSAMVFKEPYGVVYGIAPW